MNPDSEQYLLDHKIQMQQEIVKKLIDLPNENIQEATKVLFTGGQCVPRSLLSVASSDGPLMMNLNDLRRLVDFKADYKDANDVLDLVEKMESDGLSGKYVLCKYMNTREAPDINGLQSLVDGGDNKVCISLRVSEEKTDGGTEYAWHMAHITKLQRNDATVEVESRSDADNGKKVQRALVDGEKYDVYVFSKQPTPFY